MSFRGFSDDAAQARHFVNALRAFLRLDPLYDEGDSMLHAEERDLRRFYVPTHAINPGNGMTSKASVT